ncbi:MAG: RNA-binding cell elongation regulator Jag/EloR [Bacillota bacterium]|jgi:spoIIIJ-associated protein|nr:RNA-binding cell elongation regulator Jag/EloR [Bacillota bacterium]HHU30063.1 protein jag [Bacillota bacterium]
MRVVEACGKTVEKATQKALEQLSLPIERVQIEILEEPSSGLFGLIGAKQARVRVSEKITPESYMHDFLEEIIGKTGLVAEVETYMEDKNLLMNVSGQKMGMLIGKRGQTLNALQYLLNVIYHKKFPEQEGRIILDVEDYRQKREETLRMLAENLAKKVVRMHREVVLEPMTPQERRIIHTALQEHEAVRTYSEGEEPYRKVVIAPR